MIKIESVKLDVYLLQQSGVPPPQPATVEPTAVVPPPPAAYTSWERTAAADDLRRRQEELERKAAELERREQEMQRSLQLQGSSNIIIFRAINFCARQHICYWAHMLSQFRPSVCLSVTRVDQSKTFEVRIVQFSPYSSPIPLVFAH